MINQGSAFFLQQAHQNNWQQYLYSLKADAAIGWDVCILTASNERQASMYRRQLEWRREGGVLPSRTRFEVIADPDGRRIGSGGATLRALLQLRTSPSERVLLIHSGGDSRRLPHCSATGKLFARVPRELPDGRASSVFDEFLISLSGLSSTLSPGVLLASGDVLLVFDHLQVSFGRPGVIGVAAAAPADTGMHHGVYAADPESKRLRAYLHKPSYPELRAWDALDAEGRVQIDTGLVWLDRSTIERLLSLTTEQAVAKLCGIVEIAGEAPTEGLNLYGDLILPLAESSTYEGYLADTSDGPASPDVQAARRVIWERVQGIPFSVERLQPAVFVHLGTSQEYWDIAAGDPELRRTCGWKAETASWSSSPMAPPQSLPSGEGQKRFGEDGTGLRPTPSSPIPYLPLPYGESVSPRSRAERGARVRGDRSQERPASPSKREDLTVLINTMLEGSIVGSENAKAPLIADSQLRGPVSWEGAAIIARVQTAQPVRLGTDLVLEQLPVAGGGYVTRIFGMRDDPKRRVRDPSATFLNRPWGDWLARAGLAAEALWGDLPAAQRSLWNARLYPLSQDREDSLALAVPLQDPPNAPAGWLERWMALDRLSLAESFARADDERILADLSTVEDEIAMARFWAAIRAEQPAVQAKSMLGASPSSLARRTEKVALRLNASDPIIQLRGRIALAHATRDPHWEDEAFSGLSSMIGATMDWGRLPSHPRGGGREVRPTKRGSDLHQVARVETAARIDFGGGWTDTPPYGIEKGGTVLNAAITLRGAHPVVAEAERLEDPRLILESRDIDAVLEPQCAGDILAYANPADPFALQKAALVLRGIVARDVEPDRRIEDLMQAQGGGLRLSTGSSIPRGSGLGTSSILAGAVLACLAKLQADDRDSGVPSAGWDGQAASRAGVEDPAQLFDEVLLLEQMLTTGGGWQDQVGGLTGGIKLITTEPGLPQRIQVTPLALAGDTEAELAERLVLVFTGQQRLAKNLLRGVMGRWMSRDPEMVWILQEIGRLAIEMKASLERGDVQAFGEMLAQHWALNKRMDPGCSNPFIDSLFDVMTPFIHGGKLAGAGGGGFAIVMAKSHESVEGMRLELERRFSGTPVAIWDCRVPEDGMIHRSNLKV